MKQLHFEQLQETLYSETLANGLQVYILPKKGFTKTYATFTTKYGSIDRKFIPLGEEKAITVPDGIAHFLEHKMFEKEDGDVFQQFSSLGGSANAFTSFTRTAYLFSATDHLYENTKTLLDFVQAPYFTEETVEKEKGIIAQEITMYDDLPDWRLFFGTIENLYKQHPVRIDIAGTVESIQAITAEHLYTCYDTFYHPSNMVLFIVGSVNPEEMMNFVRENQEQKAFEAPIPIQRFFPDERIDAAIAHRTIEMDVTKPKVSIGMKCTSVDLIGRDLLKQELAAELVLDCLFDRSTHFYERAYETGLIDESFSYSFSMEPGYGFAMIASDTERPEEFEELVKQTVAQATNDWTIDSAHINRLKKRKIGQFMRSLNSIEFIANQFTRYHFNEMNLFEVVPMLEAITTEDLQKALMTFSAKEGQTVFIINPSEEHE